MNEVLLSVLPFVLIFLGLGCVFYGIVKLNITRRDPIAEWYHFVLPIILIIAGLALIVFTPTILNCISDTTAAATCTNCGAELAGEFCHKCGAAVDAVVKCAKCGLEAIGEFCHGCGAAIK